MAKGKAKVNYLGREGIVAHTETPDWSFIYTASLVKDPKWNIGDRVVLPDGRVFRYAYADAARTTGYAMFFNASVAQGYTNLAAAQAIGAKSVTVVSAVALTVDELRGGYITLYTGDPNNTFRGIVGNTAVAATGTVTIYLDAPLHKAVTASTGSEFFYNPYAHVAEKAIGAYASVAGIAIADLSTAGYCWIQTWGMVRLTFKPGQNPGQTDGVRQLVFHVDGPLSPHGNDASTQGDLGYRQHAGFVVDKTSAGAGSYALIMLQISP